MTVKWASFSAHPQIKCACLLEQGSGFLLNSECAFQYKCEKTKDSIVIAKKSTRSCSDSLLYPRNSSTGFAGSRTRLKRTASPRIWHLAVVGCDYQRRFSRAFSTYAFFRDYDKIGAFFRGYKRFFRDEITGNGLFTLISFRA